MKKLFIPLVFLALLLSVAALTYSVVQHRQSYVDQQQATAQQESQGEAEQRAKVEAIETELAGQRQENERLRAECDKGLMAYNSLTPFNKTRFAMPQCEPVTE